jgi:hypothetical protein
MLPEQYDTAHELDDHILPSATWAVTAVTPSLILIPNFETTEADMHVAN